MLLAPIDKAHAEQLREEFTRMFLESPTDFSIKALQRMGWIAVPAENNLSERHSANIATAARQAGIREAQAVTTEPEMHVEAVRVELSEEGLLAFDANCMLRTFLLV